MCDGLYSILAQLREPAMAAALDIHDKAVRAYQDCLGRTPSPAQAFGVAAARARYMSLRCANEEDMWYELARLFAAAEVGSGKRPS